MDREDSLEELLICVEGAANFMRGMLFDPAIPDPTKDAMRAKIKELEAVAEEHGL